MSLLAKSDPQICFGNLLDLLMPMVLGSSRFFNFEFLGPIGRYFFFRELDLGRAVPESSGHARADLSEHFHDCSSQFVNTGLFVRPSRAF